MEVNVSLLLLFFIYSTEQATVVGNLIVGNKEEKYPILKIQGARLTEANMAHAEGRGKSNVYLPFGMSCSDCR